jgi:hypothetical protein
MSNGRRICVLGWVIIALGLGDAAWALINPNFTPIHLARQSERILIVRLEKPADGKTPVTVLKALKGVAGDAKFTIDTTKITMRAHAEALERAVTEEQTGLLFLGSFAEEGENKDHEEDEEVKAKADAFLSLGGHWVTMYQRPGGVLELESYKNAYLLGVWNGGTDMLIKMTEYILKSSDPVVPVEERTMWGEAVQIGKVDGDARDIKVVDLQGEGRLCLYVASEGGDRLWRYEPKGKRFEEIGAGKKLNAKSRCAAWSDFNGDGRLDLVSWTGDQLNIYYQIEDGTFEGKSVVLQNAPTDVVGLEAADLGAAAGVTLVAGTEKGFSLWQKRKDGNFAATVVPVSAEVTAEFGKAGPVLVADFNGDKLTDVIHIHEQNSVLYLGKKGGAFAAGVPCGIAPRPGLGMVGVETGDLDADGLLDVLTGSEAGCLIWHNEGGGKFVETLAMSGEFYKTKPNAVGVAVCDFNNDGIQDLVILYRANPPQSYFNRGFRSFGYAIGLNDGENLLPSDGQEMGLAGDLNGNGAQDLAVVLPGGEVWFVPNELERELALGVVAALPVETVGPVTIKAWGDEGRCLGAWRAKGGGPGAFFGMNEAGEYEVEFVFQNKSVKRKVLVETKPVRIVSRPEDAK